MVLSIYAAIIGNLIPELVHSAVNNITELPGTLHYIHTYLNVMDRFYDSYIILIISMDVWWC